MLFCSNAEGRTVFARLVCDIGLDADAVRWNVFCRDRRPRLSVKTNDNRKHYVCCKTRNTMYLVGVDVPDDPCSQTVCVIKIVYDLGQSRTPVPTIPFSFLPRTPWGLRYSFVFGRGDPSPTSLRVSSVHRRGEQCSPVWSRDWFCCRCGEGSSFVGTDVPDDPCSQTVCVIKIVYDLGQSRTPVPTIPFSFLPHTPWRLR